MNVPSDSYTLLNQLDERLRSSTPTVSAAELHGLLTARLGVDATLTEPEWLGLVAELLTEDGDLAHDLDALLRAFYRAIRAATDPEVFEVPLPVPEDDDAATMDTRIEALADWSRGFLFGLAGRVPDAESQLSRDGHEALADIASVARAGRNDPEDQATEEEDLMTVTEHVRMSAWLLAQELAPVAAAEVRQDSSAVAAEGPR